MSLVLCRSIISEYPQSGMDAWYIISVVSVCMSDDNFRKPYNNNNNNNNNNKLQWNLAWSLVSIRPVSGLQW